LFLLSPRVALHEGRELPFRLIPRLPEPLLLLEGGFVSRLLQPLGGGIKRRRQSRLRRQRVDNQNEIAKGAFRVGITAGEGEGQSSFLARLLGKRGSANLGQYGIKPLLIKLG
jgi:hypothetical protein